MGLTIKISDIWKEYDGNPVLKDCSVSFEKSGIYVLMGHNGSGKSTFLRICSLLEEPEKGEVNYFSGQELMKKDMGLKRRITLVLPGVGIFNATVSSNMAYGLRIRGLDNKEISERVDRYLDLLGLFHKREQNALTLSSGERQRLGIARAMVIEPDILFLDEPTASVDLGNSEIIEEMILNMKKKGQPTVIITTHDVSQAHRLADSLLTLKEGRIVSYE